MNSCRGPRNPLLKKTVAISTNSTKQLGHYLSFSLNINILYVHITFSSFTKKFVTLVFYSIKYELLILENNYGLDCKQLQVRLCLVSKYFIFASGSLLYVFTVS